MVAVPWWTSAKPASRYRSVQPAAHLPCPVQQRSWLPVSRSRRPGQLARQRKSVFDGAEREVAENPDRVVVADDLVPAGDEGAVHRPDTLERAVAVPDDVAVIEVQIGR